jgi:hypothetical protein
MVGRQSADRRDGRLTRQECPTDLRNQVQNPLHEGQAAASHEPDGDAGIDVAA